MIRLKDFPICLALGFIVIYSAIGNRDSMFWSGAYFVNIYLLIMYLSFAYCPMRIKYVTTLICCPALIYVVAKYFLGIDLNGYVASVMFINSLITILLLRKWGTQEKNY